MDVELNELLQRTRDHVMTDTERDAQSISFAYGNAKLENENITRETVVRESAKLKAEENTK